jgi:hypothetical protein
MMLDDFGAGQAAVVFFNAVNIGILTAIGRLGLRSARGCRALPLAPVGGGAGPEPRVERTAHDDSLWTFALCTVTRVTFGVPAR